MAARTVHRSLIAAALLLLLAGSAAAADSCAVADVPDGNTVACADGRLLRLAGLRAPKPAAWQKGAAFAESSRQGLTELLHGRAVTWDQAVADRHGRLRVQLRRDDGLWLQAELLRRGLAMVETQSDCAGQAAELLGLEAAARAAGRGLWALDRYRVQPADAVRTDDFRIVEGRVAEVARHDGVAYVNFGRDWRRDFTLRLDKASAERFAAAGLPPESLAGRRLRVRGWVAWRNGPQMEPDHPEQIELLDEGVLIPMPLPNP